MGRVRGRDTKPELVVRKLAHRLGYRFRLHRKDLPGTPDLVFASRRKVIFVHGCWWHRHAGCPKASGVKTRPEFWNAKFARNVERDARVTEELRTAGWRLLVIWECETKDLSSLARTLTEFLSPPNHQEGSLPKLANLDRSTASDRLTV